jgi:hypothetical protein
MKKIVFYIIFFLWGMLLTVHSQGYTGLSLLISNGISQYPTACGEMLLQLNFQTSKIKLEPKAGFAYQPYMVNFAKEQHLVHAIGIVSEFAVYPCQKYFFLGICWEWLSVSWFDKNAIRELDKVALYYDKSYINVIRRWALVTGVNFNIGKRVSLKAYTLQGIHVYTIAPEFIREDFWFIQNENTTHVKFMFQFNVGIAVNFNKRIKYDSTNNFIK